MQTSIKPTYYWFLLSYGSTKSLFMVSFFVLILLAIPHALSGSSPNEWARLGKTTNASFFSVERAKVFAHFSNAAYCSAESLANWSCGPCKSADPTFSAKVIEGSWGGTQAFVGSTKGSIVISFRGSSNIQNWIKNLEFAKHKAYPKCNGCEVHSGFYGAWEEIQGRVVAEIERLLVLDPKALIYITGHSLGAALAVLCAAEIGASSHSLGYPIEGVYTFGQPRVGNLAFHNFYGKGSHVNWRLTHSHDIVPHLPMEWIGYVHTNTEIFWDENSTKYTICDHTGEDQTCSDQFLSNTWSISDHFVYVNVTICDCLF
jgi:hypothetical protein